MWQRKTTQKDIEIMQMTWNTFIVKTVSSSNTEKNERGKHKFNHDTSDIAYHTALALKQKYFHLNVCAVFFFKTAHLVHI